MVGGKTPSPADFWDLLLNFFWAISNRSSYRHKNVRLFKQIKHISHSLFMNYYKFIKVPIIVSYLIYQINTSKQDFLV